MNSIKLLEKLSLCPAPAGREEKLRGIIEEEIKMYVDEVKTDKLGNLIARKKGNGKKLMFVSPMDESALIVTGRANRMLKFHAFGNIRAPLYIGQNVIFEDGSEGIVCLDKLSPAKDFTEENMHIYPVVGNIKIGDMCVIKSEIRETGSEIICKGMENAIGCCMLLQAASMNFKTDCDVYYCFTTREQIGYMSAQTAAFEINPHYGIAVNTTIANSFGKDCLTDVQVGKGACIKVKERFMITDGQLKGKMTAGAENEHVSFQYEILKLNGTAATAVQNAHDGVLTSGIALPVRYFSTAVEVFNKKDFDECIKLIGAVMGILN